MSSILITGGAGFIGSNLAIKLKEEGHLVTVLDNLSVQIHGEDFTKSHLYQKIVSHDICFIKGDVTVKNDWEKAIENQEVIIHLAAETGTGQSMYSIEQYSRVNVQGTAIMLEVLVNQKNTVSQIILGSSRAVYGEGKYSDSQGNIYYPNPRKIENMEKGDFEISENGETLKAVATDENAKIHPISFYGMTKYFQEQMIVSVCQSIGISPVILRYQNVYGVGQSLLNPYTGILSIFSSQILENRKLNIFEDGQSTRDFIYIDDVVEATIAAINNQKCNGEIINIGTGISHSILSVVEHLVKAYQKEAYYEISGDFRIGDIRHHFADPAQMKNCLNVEPKVTFQQGITEFTNWVMTQNITENHFSESLKEMRKKGFLK